jgi:hypothetical protein
MTPHTIIFPHRVVAADRRCAGFLAATSLTFLKPRFKRFLMPFSARLARAGVVANQVATVSIVGSLIMGGMLSLFHSHSILFGLLPVWLLVRMACATIDGYAGRRFWAEKPSRRRPERGRDGHASWRQRREGTLELTLATGEVFRWERQQ